MNKILICYFSATGKTKVVAHNIAKVIGGDLFEIVPSIKYTENDLDWEDKTSRSSIEMDNINSRPEILNKVENIDNYNTILIGYPIWWYEVPQIIKTFLDEYDLSGKTVITFNTHEGSGDGGTYRYIEEQEPNANVLEGLPIRGGNMQEDQTENISNWLNELGF